MAKTQYICMSNRIIMDQRLKPSAVRVMSVLIRFRRPDGTASLALERIASLSSCSVRTVQSSIKSLSEAGYMAVEANYRRSGIDVLRTTNIYHLPAQGLTEGYTQIPVKLCTAPVTHAAFRVACYLLKLIGTGKRAFPSLRKGFEKSLGLARATVIAAIRQLVSNGFFFVLACRKANRARSMNSYCVCAWGESVQQEAVSVSQKGGLIFAKPCFIPKITRVIYLRKKSDYFCYRKMFLKQEAKLCLSEVDCKHPRPPPAAADRPP